RPELAVADLALGSPHEHRATPAQRAVAARRHRPGDGRYVGSRVQQCDNPGVSSRALGSGDESWRTLASATVPRLYHSAAVLLPDGRRLAPLQTAPQVAQALLGDLKADLQIGSRGLQLCQPLQVGSRFVGKLHG